MSFYAFSGLANALVSTTLGLFFFLRAPHNAKHQAYGLYCLSLAIWSYFYFAWQLSESRDVALLFIRLLMAGAILIPATYLHHVLTLLDIAEKHKLVLKAGYVISGFFLLSDLTPYFIADLKPEMSFPYWPKPGVLFHFYLAWFGGYTVYAVSLLAKSFYRAKGRQRNQYLYLMLGALIGYGGGSTNFPLWYGIQIPPNGNILVTVYAIIVAYTLVRYRLLDLSVAVEKVLTNLLLVVLVMLPAYPILLVAQKRYFGTINYSFSLVLLVLLALLVLGAYQVRLPVQMTIARTFFTRRYHIHETLSQFSKTLVTNLDLKSLTEEIVRTLVKVIGIKTASLYVLNKEKEVFELVSFHGLDPHNSATISLKAQDDLQDYLERSASIAVREELQHVEPRTSMTWSVLNALESMMAEVSIPFINKDRLIGYCNLGPRSNFKMYSQADLDLLDTLARNAAIAVDNALLYEDLRKQKALLRRTDRLRSLETIAGGFAHEIRNPLTSIKTFVQLTPTKKDDPEFIGSFGTIVAEDVARIERLIQEILDYSKYMEPQFKEENLNDVVESCLYFIEVKATNRHVTIQKELARDLPPITLDRQQMKQVLLNLFLNGLEAMSEDGGRLTVKTRRLAKQAGVPWVQIEVTDTGSGIAHSDLEHIFDPFYTTKHESAEREGTGLGLTIVHQITEEHGGIVEVQSEVGCGTTFFVHLPASREHLIARRNTHPVPAGRRDPIE